MEIFLDQEWMRCLEIVSEESFVVQGKLLRIPFHPVPVHDFVLSRGRVHDRESSGS